MTKASTLPAGSGVHVGLHYGVASYPADGKTVDFLMKVADLRLYQCRAQAKFEGPERRQYPRFAMSDTIADVAASVFASQFYAAIASAQTVGVALAQAKVAMEIAQLDDAELPEAIARDDVDIDDLVLVRQPS